MPLATSSPMDYVTLTLVPCAGRRGSDRIAMAVGKGCSVVGSSWGIALVPPEEFPVRREVTDYHHVSANRNSQPDAKKIRPRVKPRRQGRSRPSPP